MENMNSQCEGGFSTKLETCATVIAVLIKYTYCFWLSGDLLITRLVYGKRHGVAWKINGIIALIPYHPGSCGVVSVMQTPFFGACFSW
jgi:hypothetical protein